MSVVVPWTNRRLGMTVVALGLAILGMGVVTHVWYVSCPVDATVYSADDLERGSICQIIPWEDGRTAVQISQVSHLPADRFWQIITDHHAYPDLMPGVEITAERDLPDGTTAVQQVLHMPHADYHLQLSVRREQQGTVRKWHWRQTSGPLAADDGAFVVEDHGDRTVLRYQVSATVPGCPQWLVNYTMRRRHAGLFDLMENYARQDARHSAGHAGEPHHDADSEDRR